MLNPELKNTLIRFQSGKASIRDERVLATELSRRFKPHTEDNYLYDRDDIYSEYMSNSWKALHRANPDLGDPFAFASNRGYKSTLDYYRKVSSAMLIKECSCCGHTMTYDRRNVKCKKCGSTELVGFEKHQSVPNNERFSVSGGFEADLELQDFIKACLEKIRSADIDEVVKEVLVESIETRESIKEVCKRYRLTKIQLASLSDVQKELFGLAFAMS